MPYYVYNGETSTGLTLNQDYMYVMSGGSANKTTVNSGTCFAVVNVIWHLCYLSVHCDFIVCDFIPNYSIISGKNKRRNAFLWRKKGSGRDEDKNAENNVEKRRENNGTTPRLPGPAGSARNNAESRQMESFFTASSSNCLVYSE